METPRGFRVCARTRPGWPLQGTLSVRYAAGLGGTHQVMEEAGLRRVCLFRQRPEKRGACRRAETETAARMRSRFASARRSTSEFRVILCPERGAVAGIAARHADVDFVALADRQRRRGDGGFERRFLRGEVALDIAVVEHAPAVANGDDGILRKSHSCLLFRAGAVGFDVLVALRHAIAALIAIVVLAAGCGSPAAA